MSKKSLSEDQKVTDVASFETDPDKLLRDAKTWANALWRKARLTAPKDDLAMRKAAHWAKVTPNTLWKLRYRPPRDIGVSIYNRLRVAYDEHVESVEGQVAENLAALKALPSTPSRERLVAQMEEFLGTSQGEEEEMSAALLWPQRTPMHADDNGGNSD
jgi:hypothetical protein